MGSNNKQDVGLREYACPLPKTGTYQAFTIVGQSRAPIYCNFISLHVVGCHLVRCLRTFTFPSQYCDLKFDNVYYLPVENTVFRYIHIEISTADGKPITLTDSKVNSVSVLHFRRVSMW